MQSMTGFGHVERQFKSFDLMVEIKTVNSRFLDFKARLSHELAQFESKIKAEVQKQIIRGRVDLFLELRHKSENLYTLNEPLVANYIQLSGDLAKMGVSGNLNVSDLLAIPGCVIQKEEAGFSRTDEESILSAVRETVALVSQSRRDEGENIQSDLEKRLDNLDRWIQEIAQYKDAIEQHYRERLENRIKEYLEREVIDEQRLAQEILYQVDRVDISEEITRLSSHIKRFRGYLKTSETAPVGKKLDFLCQEMNREMNTIMSKSGGIQVTEIGVEGKAEIERIREQIQNVE